MKLALSTAFAGMVLLAAASAVGLRINTSDSVPVGLWYQRSLAGGPIRGMTVAVCPPAARAFEVARVRHYIDGGWCPSHLEMLLKPVAAVAGDTVSVTAHGIFVNGVLLQRSAALTYDTAGRPLYAFPEGRYRVLPGYVWLVSSYNDHSFDSRYFGPMSVAQVRGRLQPVWVMRGRS